jgi:hypothetical protein
VYDRHNPRYATSAPIEEDEDSVIVTWSLGGVVPGGADYFGFEVYYFGVDRQSGKRFGVRFREKLLRMCGMSRVAHRRTTSRRAS